VVDLVHLEGVVQHDTARILEYEALSYTWGDPKILRPIRINDTVFNVTENLYQALLTLRTQDYQRWLWIDAVCIHQTDLQEKSQHLRRIFTVYRKALKVLVFLGQCGPNTHHAFEYLRARNLDAPHAKDMETFADLPRVYDGLRDLWTRPWLWRIWVRQEIFAARRVLVICGDNLIEWDDFTGLAFALGYVTREMQSRGFDADTVDNRKRRTVESLWNCESDSLPRILCDEYPDERGSATNIVEVLGDTVGCEMSDPRDQVYGILGMTKTKIARPGPTASENRVIQDRSHCLVVDYSKDLASVFVDVARYVFNRDQSLHALYLCQCWDSKKTDLCLPSWCPDWRYETSDAIFKLHDRIHGWISNLNSDDVSPPRAVPLCSSEAHELVVAGVVLGEIVNQCEATHWPLKDEKIPHPGFVPEKSVESNPLLPYFKSHQKNGPVKLRPGVLNEIIARRHGVTEAGVIRPFSARFYLRGNDFDGQYRSRIASHISNVISTMLIHFWAIPKGAAQSDLVVALRGGLLPVVLRPDHSGNFRYIGPMTLCQCPFIDEDNAPLTKLPLYIYMLISRVVDTQEDPLRTFTIR
jgi:hypothetical protein